MKKIFSKISPKFRLYIPIVTGIIISVLIITIYSVNKTRNNIHRSLERSLTTEVETIKRMFERERDLKLSKVKNDLNVARYLFYEKEFRIPG